MSIKKKKIIIFVSIIIALVVVMLLSVGIGRYSISPAEILRMIYDKIAGNDMSVYNKNKLTVVFTLRIPRITANILIGSGLATAGAVYQAIFQNQLVSSDILGVSNGASVGAALAMLLGWNHIGIQSFAFMFGVGAVCSTVILASAFREKGNLTLVLSGMIVSGLMSSLLSLIKYSADENSTLPDIVYWLMGSMASITVLDVQSVLIPIIICQIILFALSWKINIISMGENEAKLVGVNVTIIKAVCIICSSLLTVCCVCISGVIGWFGLMLPHIGRMIIGTDNRNLLPFCSIFGALIMVILDTISRRMFISEIPIGILTGITGTIVFSILIIVRRRKYEN